MIIHLATCAIAVDGKAACTCGAAARSEAQAREDKRIKSEREIPMLPKVAFDNLIVAISKAHESGVGSPAKQDKLEELSRHIADITPNWQQWFLEIGSSK